MSNKPRQTVPHRSDPALAEKNRLVGQALREWEGIRKRYWREHDRLMYEDPRPAGERRSDLATLGDRELEERQQWYARWGHLLPELNRQHADVFVNNPQVVRDLPPSVLKRLAIDRTDDDDPGTGSGQRKGGGVRSPRASRSPRRQ